MRHEKLIGNQRFYMVPPIIMIRMSGVQQASQGRDGGVTLHYVDGSEETATIAGFGLAEFQAKGGDFFGVVSRVQACRTQCTEHDGAHVRCANYPHGEQDVHAPECPECDGDGWVRA